MSLFKFPLILAGPIIRRVEPTRIYIWIATSKRYQIKAALFKIDHKCGDANDHYQSLETTSEINTVMMGKRLYINLIKVNPKNGNFPTDTLLGYNLEFIRGSKQHDLEVSSF